MAISRQDALKEAFKRGILPLAQAAAYREASRRGLLDIDSPQLSEPQATIEPVETRAPVLPSSMNQEDFNRIQRTGLTPGTAIDFAGVSIETENASRQAKGIPGLNPRQAEARLRMFQQQAGTPRSETRDEFAEIQKIQRGERAGTLAGRVQTAGIAALSTIGEAGLSAVGLVAPEFANRTSEEFQTILNPEFESRAGMAGQVAGEAAKTVGLAGKLGAVGLGAAFGIQGAGGVRREVQEQRELGKEISLTEELTTAAAVGGVEAVSGVVTSKIFGSLGNTLRSATPAARAALRAGERGAVAKFVRDGLKTVGNIILEGGEEGLTQVITNKIRNEGIDAGVAITEGVLESIVTGALLAPLGGGMVRVSAADGPSANPTSQTMLTAIQQGRESAKVATREAGPTALQRAMSIGGQQQAEADKQASIQQAAARQERVDESDDQAIERLLGRQTEEKQQVETAAEGRREFRELIGQPAQKGAIETETITPSQTDVEQQAGVPVSTETNTEKIERLSGQRSPDGTTSARFVDLDANREAMNQLLLEKTNVRTWQEALTTAQEQRIPERAIGIAQSIVANPRAMDDIETAGVVQRLVGVLQDHDNIVEKIEGAEGTDLTILSSEMQRLEESHDLLTTALKASGSEKGRALNAQKLTLNRNFDLVSILATAKATKNDNLTTKQRDQLTTLHRQIKALQSRLDRLDNQPESESPTLNTARNTEAEHLRFQKSVLQGKVNRKIESLAPQNIFVKGTKGTLGLMRALKSSFDVSAVGRQAGLSVLGNPVRAIKALKPMFQAMVSEQSQFRINEAIQANPDFEGAKLAGLRITDTNLGAKLTDKEETYRSTIAEHIPGVRASDRAFTTFLNVMRMESYSAITKTLSRTGKPTMDESKVVAQLVNNFTGFGGLANQRTSAAVLNTVFWSPSLQLARMQVLTGSAFRKGMNTSPRVRNLVAKEYAKTLTGFATVMMLGLLAGFEIEVDPRSSDFLKLKKGNTRIDFGSGLMQYVVLASREISGKIKSPVTGKVRALRGPSKRFGAKGTAEVAASFVRSKFTPGLGLFVDLMAQENVIGQPVTDPQGVAKLLPEIPGTVFGVSAEGIKNVTVNALVPLSINEVFESLQEQGIPAGTAFGILSLFGEGVQNFGKKELK